MIHRNNSRQLRRGVEGLSNTLAPARVEWQNVSIAGGKPTPQTMRLSGKQMNLRFDGQNQLQQLVSSGGVEVTRQLGEAQDQTTASRELIEKFSGAGEWSTIDQVGDVRFRDGQGAAQGERAHLDRATNTATLTGSVVLTDATTRTTAQSAVFTPNSNQLQADGNVLSTELRGGTGGISNFDQEPGHVSADHLVADTARGHATNSGNGRLWQGQSVIEADTIELDSPSHVLVARGKACKVFPAGLHGLPDRARRRSSQPAGRLTQRRAEPGVPKQRWDMCKEGS